MDDIHVILLDDFLTHFSEPELEEFCFRLGDITYGDLGGTTRRAKIRHLIGFMQRRNQMRRLVRALLASRSHLKPKYFPLLNETDRLSEQAAAIDDALGWLDDVTAGESDLLDETPTLTWPSDELDLPMAEPESKLSWIDELAQGGGAAVEEPPTMTWPSDSHEQLPANPYNAGRMVKDPAMFFGREEERRRLRSRLLNMGSSAIVGRRRIGKSSLLYHLCAHVELPAEQRFLVAFLDLQDSQYHTLPGLLNGAWQQWLEQVSEKRPSSIPQIQGLADFSRWVRALHAKGFRPVLALDEFEQLTARPGEFSDDIFEGWRALGNDGQLAFLTASQQPLGNLIQQSGLTSNFDNIFYQLELGLLREPAARALLAEPAGRQEVDLPETAVSDLLTYAGHHPFYLQMAAFALFDDLVSRDGEPDLAAVKTEFYRQAARHWRGLWRSLAADAQALFPIRPTAPETPAARIVYRALAGQGVLVEEEDGRYRPFSRGFVEWLLETHPERAPAEPEPDDGDDSDDEAAPGWWDRLLGRR